MSDPSYQSTLDQPYPLTPDQIAYYQTNGYIKLKQVLPPALLTHYAQEITRKVKELNTLHLPMEQRNTYQKAFLQVMNLWTQSDLVKQLVFSKRLAKIATDLMANPSAPCRGVRLYHDQALYKEPSGGVTPWHADQFYWPLDTNHTVTAWIPLQHTPMELGPLAFSARSQTFNAIGRDIEISDESEQKLSKALLESGLPLDEAPFDLGEISYHSGWTFHRAGPNKSTRPREVMTIIYMDQNAHVIPPKHKAHTNDLATWLPTLRPGDLAASPLNPILFSYD